MGPIPIRRAKGILTLETPRSCSLVKDWNVLIPHLGFERPYLSSSIRFCLPNCCHSCGRYYTALHPTNSSIICTMFETKMKSGHFLPICLMQVRIICKPFRCGFFCLRLPPGGSADGCLIVSGRRRGKYFDTGDRGAAYSQRRQAGAALTAFDRCLNSGKLRPEWRNVLIRGAET